MPVSAQRHETATSPSRTPGPTRQETSDGDGDTVSSSQRLVVRGDDATCSVRAALRDRGSGGDETGARRVCYSLDVNRGRRKSVYYHIAKLRMRNRRRGRFTCAAILGRDAAAATSLSILIQGILERYQSLTGRLILDHCIDASPKAELQRLNIEPLHQCGQSHIMK